MLQNGKAIGWPFCRKSGTARLFSVYSPIDIGEAILKGMLEFGLIIQDVETYYDMYVGYSVCWKVHHQREVLRDEAPATLGL